MRTNYKRCNNHFSKVCLTYRSTGRHSKQQGQYNPSKHIYIVIYLLWEPHEKHGASTLTIHLIPVHMTYISDIQHVIKVILQLVNVLDIPIT